MDRETEDRVARMLHHRKAGLAKGDPIAPPIVSAATFHLPDVQGAPFIYGRNAMPTWESLEAQLAVLEDADCVAFPSGMAAITAALFATLRAGAKVILPSDGYYVTRVLSEGFLAPFGVEVALIPTRDFPTARAICSCV
jgi:cystathionine gamma-lyase